jgi:1,4-alpha-glucan branching enzyme
MLVKQEGREPHTVLVTFQFPASIWLDSIYLVGDFNNWDRHSLPLKRSLHNPYWQITLVLPRGRSYQFRYLIDGTTWCNDCSADRYLPNPYGGYNSVVDT